MKADTTRLSTLMVAAVVQLEPHLTKQRERLSLPVAEHPVDGMIFAVHARSLVRSHDVAHLNSSMGADEPKVTTLESGERIGDLLLQSREKIVSEAMDANRLAEGHELVRLDAVPNVALAEPLRSITVFLA